MSVFFDAEVERVLAAIDPDRSQQQAVGLGDLRSAVALIRSLRARVAELEASVGKLSKVIDGCDWYWTSDDTSSDACSHSPHEALCLCPGDISEYARGGTVQSGWYGYLPPAADSDSDDDFEVDEPTYEAARAKLDAEIARRSSLPIPTEGGENGW